MDELHLVATTLGTTGDALLAGVSA